MRKFLRRGIMSILALSFVFTLPSITFAETDVTDKIQIEKSRLTYDRRGGTSSVDVSLINISDEILVTPIKVVITDISSSDVKLINPDGYTANGLPFFEYVNVQGGIIPNEKTDSKDWLFENLERKRFNYSYQVIGILPEAAAVIGPEGGVVEVSNPVSPFYGLEIFFPAGTVQAPTIFSVKTQSAIPNVPLPAGFAQDGPMISFEATTDLLGPVVVDVPFSGSRVEDELRLFLHFNETTQSWEPIVPLPTTDPGKMKALLTSFSIFTKSKAQKSLFSIYSGFNINKDALAADNDRGGCIYDNGQQQNSGICVGMSLVAEAYFNHYAEQNGEGVRCWWTKNTSWDVACSAHGLYNGGKQGWLDDFYLYLESLGLIIGLPADDGYLVDYLKFQLLSNHTTSINMLGLSPFVGHSILVTGWEKTGLFSGKFIVYDNQENDLTMELNYYSYGIGTSMDYQDVNGHNYDLFTTTSIGVIYQSIFNLIENTPREDACGGEEPTFGIISPSVLPEQIEVGDTLVLEAGGGSGSYVWTFTGGTLISATGPIAVWQAPNPPGIYFINVKDANDSSLSDGGPIVVYPTLYIPNKPSQPPTIQPGSNSGVYTVTGGDSSNPYAWSVSGPEYVPSGTGVSYTFVAPSTNSFSGFYTVTVTDIHGFNDSFVIRVP